MCSARLAGCSHVAEAPAAQVRLGHLTELALDTVGGRTGGNHRCEMMKSMTLVWWPERGRVYSSPVLWDQTAFGGKVANRDRSLAEGGETRRPTWRATRSLLAGLSVPYAVELESKAWCL